MAEFDALERDRDPPRWLRLAIWLSIPVATFAFGMAIVSIDAVTGSRLAGSSLDTGPIRRAGADAPPRPWSQSDVAERAASAVAEQLPTTDWRSAAPVERVQVGAAAEEVRQQAPRGIVPSAPGPSADPASGQSMAVGTPVPPTVIALPGPARVPAPGPGALPLPVPPMALTGPPVGRSPAPRTAAPTHRPGRVEVPRPGRTDPHCVALTARVQLGEQPNNAEQRLLRSACTPSA